ncbi:DUF4192 domain-containing protein [Paractinoplanes toevensis]|uniref:DUF4192 domain-containing protein n=1 Tax=Paractinoplanes toevensis TaxID=571911 RepID=A0A919WDE9_9ACTN|nr:DUF4192 domain-containing protein [Actinoplanes toevensis]GIM98050.1 hypothetical protein Ato02nite_098430 [Actinoplanes toevensis]
MTRPPTPLRFASPADIVGAVPYLLGYHPDNEIVALYLDGRRRVITSTSVPLTQPSPARLAHLALHIPASQAAGIVLIGYGSETARSAVTAAGEVFELLRAVHGLFLVTGNRCVCLLPGCTCPATDGIEVDPTTTASAAQLSVAGRVALPSRTDLHRLVAADPAGQTEIETALTAVPAAFRPDAGHVTFSLAQASNGHRLTGEQAAEFVIALTDPDLLAMARHSVCGCMWQRDLWLDLTRRAPDSHLAGPAGLAAWCAWRRGETALAEAALHRARQAAAANVLTDLVGRILHARLSARLLTRPPA